MLDNAAEDTGGDSNTNQSHDQSYIEEEAVSKAFILCVF
jgi:hypothetical protein